MQQRIIINKFVLSLVAGFLMFFAKVALADNSASQYTMELVEGRSNVWALPEPESQDPQSRPRYYEQQRQYEAMAQRYQRQQLADQFVTPEFLEKLKQQQTQNQMMPENRRFYQSASPQQSPQQYNLQRYRSNPSYGTGYINPLYETPVITPWSTGPDVLYHGESGSLVPDEALGGLSPLEVDPFGGSEGNAEPGYEDIERETNVFDPFRFGRSGNFP